MSKDEVLALLKSRTPVNSDIPAIVLLEDYNISSEIILQNNFFRNSIHKGALPPPPAKYHREIIAAIGLISFK